MSWQPNPLTANLTPDFHSHPGVWDCGLEGAGLFAKALSYCAEHLTNGRVPGRWLKSQVPRGDRRQVIKKLVAADLLERDERDFVVVGYLAHNPSRDEAVEYMKLARNSSVDSSLIRTERARKAAMTRWQNGALIQPTPENAGDSGIAEHRVSMAQASPQASAKHIQQEEVVQETYAEDIERLCSLLSSLIVQNGARAPSVTAAWRTETRRLIERDKRTPADIERVIRWCQDDSFWRANILSMPKLRKQFDQLWLRMTQNGAAGPAPDDDKAFFAAMTGGTS